MIALPIWLLCVVLVSVAAGCESEPGVDSGGSLASTEGQLAFMRATSFDGPEIDSDIYTINVDGSEERRLTDTPGLDGFPSWTPDGERIAFASDRDGGNWELYTMNADGSQQQPLTNTPYQDESVTAWSPNGEKIAYVTDVIDYPVIRIMNSDGSGQRQLTSGNWPSWSPDGEKIVYTAYAGERPHLAVMNADGSESRSLDASLLQRLSGRVSDEEPAFSPNGETIAFASENDGEIYVMNSDGSGRTRLTDLPSYDHWPPTWSPDGERIAFTSEDKKGSEIYMMNSDGSGLTKLTDNPAEDSFPAWRPR